MKKIAFMFAAAAMMVACGEKAQEIVLNAEDSAAVVAAVEAQIAEEIGEAPVMAELAEDATEEVKAAAQTEFDAAVAAFEQKKGEIEATKEARVAEALVKCLEEKKAAAQNPEKKEGEQK